ncbi:hypothetical protein N864_04770 [Intrasporangium chromatireducens Q5-1]|uniref:Uncharacterized protein n=1 Tax=Intrasporangium chromatireducens Q5-1 TaxID=584657 RepID=W9GGT7_9MICO|nr:hypothetical protein [Intrasporangium chromatireducens]EWT05456.1 hypothetical protein N864_04770 [Intrasporangium chromatireducens Q5-1]
MDTTNSTGTTGSDPDQGDLEAAKEHEGREEENVGAELLDSVTGANEIDGDNGRSGEEAVDDPASMRSGLSGKPGGGETPGSTAP